MENQNEKIENVSIKDIVNISDLNLKVSQFQVEHDAIKQAFLLIAIKKSKKENIPEEDIALFKRKVTVFNELINFILEN